MDEGINRIFKQRYNRLQIGYERALNDRSGFADTLLFAMNELTAAFSEINGISRNAAEKILRETDTEEGGDEDERN